MTFRPRVRRKRPPKSRLRRRRKRPSGSRLRRLRRLRRPRKRPLKSKLRRDSHLPIKQLKERPMSRPRPHQRVKSVNELPSSRKQRDLIKRSLIRRGLIKNRIRVQDSICRKRMLR